MKWVVLIGALLLAAMFATTAGQAQTTWNHIPYPAHPEGAILTLPGPSRIQFIIAVNELKDPSAEAPRVCPTPRSRTPSSP